MFVRTGEYLPMLSHTYQFQAVVSSEVRKMEHLEKQEMFSAYKQLSDKFCRMDSYLTPHDLTTCYLFLNLEPGLISQVSLQDITSHLGMTPQTLCRIRRNLQKKH